MGINIGLARTVCTYIHRIFGDFPVKNTVYTLCIYLHTQLKCANTGNKESCSDVASCLLSNVSGNVTRSRAHTRAHTHTHTHTHTRMHIRTHTHTHTHTHAHTHNWPMLTLGRPLLLQHYTQKKPISLCFSALRQCMSFMKERDEGGDTKACCTSLK